MRRVLRPGDEVLVVPAIPGEGRALFDAVAAQGLAGVLARQRTSPYLAGVRSRLWRFIPVLPGGRDEAAAAAAATLEQTAGRGPARRPSWRLIRRLPLGLDEPVAADEPARPARARGPARGPPRRIRTRTGPLAVEQDAGGVDTDRQPGHEADGRDQEGIGQDELPGLHASRRSAGRTSRRGSRRARRTRSG